MSDLFTGVFIALGSIWFKDYLDNKKNIKTTTQQKASEAYSLTDNSIHCLNSTTVACLNLIKNRDLNYSIFLERYPNDSSDVLDKLELLIIRNFHDLWNEFFQLRQVIINQSSYLIDILVNINLPDFTIIEEDFNNRHSTYRLDVVNACNALKNSLVSKYINKSNYKPNIYNCWNSVSEFLEEFFKKPSSL